MWPRRTTGRSATRLSLGVVVSASEVDVGRASGGVVGQTLRVGREAGGGQAKSCARAGWVAVARRAVARRAAFSMGAGLVGGMRVMIAGE